MCCMEGEMPTKEPTWIDQLVRAGALVPIDLHDSKYHPGGVVLICDSETNPSHFVDFGVPGAPVVLIANEAGVLIASPDSSLVDGLGIDVEPVIITPIRKAYSRGIHTVILCMNTMASSGPFSDHDIVALVDHLLRAAVELRRTIRGVTIECIVHVPMKAGMRNFRPDPESFREFYRIYEIDELDHNDEADEHKAEVAARRAAFRKVEQPDA